MPSKGTVSAGQARAVLNASCSELDLQDAIVEYAERRGWRCWHDTDSRRNDAGFPDLLLMRGDCLVWAELKTERGRLRAAQEDWLEELEAAGEEVYLWRPSNWQSGEIEERLA